MGKISSAGCDGRGNLGGWRLKIWPLPYDYGKAMMFTPWQMVVLLVLKSVCARISEWRGGYILLDGFISHFLDHGVLC